MDFATLLEPVRALALEAGHLILGVYHSDFAVRAKDDRSPVTAADEVAERAILAGLRRLTPDLPIVAEEEAAAGRIPVVGAGPFWLVDPLDGTKEFIKRNGEFTVNIALVVAGRPVLGVVHAPVPGKTWVGATLGGAVARLDQPDQPGRAIAARLPPDEGLTVIASRSHNDPAALASWLAGRRVAAETSAGSSLKFCLVAEGLADLYPRFGRTMEWDTAAGHAVLLAAGGQVTTLDGAPLLYGKAGFENPHFVARGRGA